MIVYPDDNWQTMPPEQAGIPSSAIENFLIRTENEPMNLHGLILLCDGYKVLEKYTEPCYRDRAEHVYSITKSVVSLLAGIAISEGLLDDESEVCSYFPEYEQSIADKNMKSLKVKHLLTMSSGQIRDIEWDRKDAVARFFKTPIPHEPGSRFVYLNGCSTMISAIVQKVTGISLVDYADEKLFSPLGIEKPHWNATPDGICYGGFGIWLKTEDIARIGLLLLGEGRWRDREIVPPEYVVKATSALRPSFTHSDPNWISGYGYFFWQNAPTLGGYHGVGLRGHYCIVLPNERLVCAATADGEMFRLLHALEEEIVLPMRNRSLLE